MTSIAFVLTTTPWSDRRQHVRQAPALRGAGFEIIYFSGEVPADQRHSFDYRTISPGNRRRARRTGALNCYWAIKAAHADFVQLCSLEQLPLGIALKLFTNSKVIYDCREDMAPAMLRHRSKFPLIARWGMYFITVVLEYLASQMFDGMITADPAVLEKHAAMPKQRKMIFFNAAQLRDFGDDYPPLQQREFDLVVMGSMSPRTGVLDAVIAAGLIKSRRGLPVKLLLLGQPDDEVSQDIQRVVRQYDIEDQVVVTGVVPHAEVPKLLVKAKIGLVPLHDLGKFRTNIACKAFEYMACGMPCICSDLQPQRFFVEEGKHGEFYPPNDPEALASRIESMLSDIHRAETMGGDCRRAVEEKWNAEAFEARLVSFYEKLRDAPAR